MHLLTKKIPDYAHETNEMIIRMIEIKPLFLIRKSKQNKYLFHWNLVKMYRY